jgi:hypothetical protein
MWKWFLSTFTYWSELSKDIRIWWIFKRTATQYTEQLNKDFALRVDWLGRIYGVVNLPEEVQTASGEIQQAYVLNKISTYGNFMLQIGLADVVYPQIEKIPGSASYLVVLWPVFDELSLLPVLGNILKTAVVSAILYVIFKFIMSNTELWIALWNKLTFLILN